MKTLLYKYIETYMLEDFTNYSLKKIKDLIVDYRENNNVASLNLLLARFDLYILYVLYDLKKRYSYLQDEEITELYQTGVLGFYNGIKAFKLHLNPQMVLLVIKAYIKAEIKQTYAYKDKEINGAFMAPKKNLSINTDELLLKESIFSSEELTDREKEIIRLRFFEGLDVKDVAKKLNDDTTRIFNQLARLMKKLKKTVFKEEKIK